MPLPLFTTHTPIGIRGYKIAGRRFQHALGSWDVGRNARWVVGVFVSTRELLAYGISA